MPALKGLGMVWAKDMRVWAVRDVAFLRGASKAELKERMSSQLRTPGTGRTDV